ncbi:MAG: HGGxSTG domain-containing protein, partial [Candidatus Thalassarchaeaceae archaeon]|nr:HGGxSTG domain-containing protein [Candidatus Thalassarchaeaceae archaeon]
MDRKTLKQLPRCGARNRKGAPCRKPSMDNGRCRFHGGMSTGPPVGNQNAAKHGIYASALLAHEIEEYLGAKKLKSLTEDLAMARIRLLRAERVHKELE